MYVGENLKGSIVKGTVIEVDAKMALIQLADSVEGHLRASELSREQVEDARTVLKVGDEIDAKFIGVDRKNRTIMLSIKAKDNDDEADTVSEYGAGKTSTATTLGDLIKEKMETQG
jgi:small subunit ribosomal protein S1